VGSARKKYTEEYKAEAVEFVISSGRPLAEVARNLGINEGTLANWVNKAKKNGTVQENPWMSRNGPSLRSYARNSSASKWSATS
jgi:transposase-like protein